jgi:hypothetical protein
VTAEEIYRQQRDRWLSGKYFGSNKPAYRVLVRRGHLERHYENLPDSEVHALIPGLKGPNAVWFARWVADDEWVEVPNVLEITGDGDFDQNGIENCTIKADNVVMTPEMGLAGLFHVIKRGYLSPLRGAPGARGAIEEPNEWFERFKEKATQIIVLAGYGEAVIPLHLGLLDDADLTSAPDEITLTCRSMGVFLTDQRVFMDAKHLWVRDPITFQDRLAADELEDVATYAEAKTRSDNHPARLAVDEDEDSAWISAAHDDPMELEWIEIPLPKGRYVNFEIYTAYPGLEMFVSVHATNDNVPGGGEARGTDGTVYGEGWVNNGGGSIPGGDIPVINHVSTVKNKAARYDIQPNSVGLLVGDNSKIRLWFRNLYQAADAKGRAYRAGVREVRVYRREREAAAEQQHWILVDDVADVVKVVLQWAGFTEWEVENTGVRLLDKVGDKLVFDRQAFLIDIIKKIAEMIGYVFYIKPPESFDLGDLSTDANLSMGIPVFRRSSASREQATVVPGYQVPVESVRDETIITGIDAKFSQTDMPDSIRVRGKTVKQKIASQNPGSAHALGEDRTLRWQYSYRPVWARGGRSAHLRRPVVKTEPQYANEYQCKVACLEIALRYALSAAQASVEIPLWPYMHLDDHLLVYEKSTGLSTRIWLAMRNWQIKGGDEPEFSMTVGGALLDTPDVQDTRVELQRVLNNRGFDPAPIGRGAWEDPRFF